MTGSRVSKRVLRSATCRRTETSLGISSSTSTRRSTVAFTTLDRLYRTRTDFVWTSSPPLQIAFDEWNLRGWHHPDGNNQDSIDARALNDLPSTYTMADAIFSAGFLNACLRNANVVAMANIAPTVNARGPLFVHPDGLVRRTTFHAMRMYVDHIRERILATATRGPELTHAGASVSSVEALVSADAGGYTLTIVNRDPSRNAECSVVIDRQELTGAYHGELLTAPSPDSYNSIEQPEVVAPHTLTLRDHNGKYSVPPHSILMLFVPKAS